MPISCSSLTFLTTHFVQDFHKTHSPHFSLTTILPTCIGGPNVLPLTKGIDSLSLSQALLWKTATDASELPKPDWPGWVDVRDVAKAHVNALVTPQAAGKRWILCTTLVSYSDVRSLHSTRPLSNLMSISLRLQILFGATSHLLLHRRKFRK